MHPRRDEQRKRERERDLAMEENCLAADRLRRTSRQKDGARKRRLFFRDEARGRGKTEEDRRRKSNIVVRLASTWPMRSWPIPDARGVIYISRKYKGEVLWFKRWRRERDRRSQLAPNTVKLGRVLRRLFATRLLLTYGKHGRNVFAQSG